MEKVWYILIEDIEEGPFSSRELFFDNRVTLDTLVWKEGYGNWVPLRLVDELRELFEEKPRPREEEPEEAEHNGISPQDELVLDYSRDPNFLFLWLVIILVLVCYLVYKLYGLV